MYSWNLQRGVGQTTEDYGPTDAQLGTTAEEEAALAQGEATIEGGTTYGPSLSQLGLTAMPSASSTGFSLSQLTTWVSNNAAIIGGLAAFATLVLIMGGKKR